MLEAIAAKILYTQFGAMVILGIATKFVPNRKIEETTGPFLETLGRSLSSKGRSKFGKLFYEPVEEYLQKKLLFFGYLIKKYFFTRGLDWDDKK